MAEDVHASSKNLEPCATSRLDAVRNRLSGQKRGKIQAGVVMDGQGTIGTIGRGDQTELATLLRLIQGKLLVTRLQPFALRQQPDLVEMDRFLVRGVELAVAHAGPGGHALQFPSP